MSGAKWKKHYSSYHKILLVGEGDFSFSVCLAKAFGSAANMVATSLDSKEMVIKKYPTGEANLEVLKMLGCTIIHGVDCRTMSKHPCLIGRVFDRVIYNFPHVGFRLPENHQPQIKLNQELVQGFFESARLILKAKGEVHVTHKTTHPYYMWELENLAKQVGLCLVDEVAFDIKDYPGYENKRGAGKKAHFSFAVGDSSTFKFSLLSISAVQVIGDSLLVICKTNGDWRTRDEKLIFYYKMWDHPKKAKRTEKDHPYPFLYTYPYPYPYPYPHLYP